MNDLEIREWMELLSHFPNRTVKATIDDLMVHASDDEMSGEDRTICVRALELIEEDRQRWAYGAGPGTLAGNEDL